jgi:hypothetical protein
MLTDYYFWFAQPSSILNTYDWVAGYIFVGFLALSIIASIISKLFVTHPVVKKLMSKWYNALLWSGIIGLIWFGFRYEAVPIFSKRAWGGGALILALVWLGFVKWYLVRHFLNEKREYDYNSVKSKYIPNGK